MPMIRMQRHPPSGDPKVFYYTRLVCGRVQTYFHVCLFVPMHPPARMSGEEVNPAAVPVQVKDVQGDGRWMSQVRQHLAEL